MSPGMEVRFPSSVTDEITDSKARESDEGEGASETSSGESGKGGSGDGGGLMRGPRETWSSDELIGTDTSCSDIERGEEEGAVGEERGFEFDSDWTEIGIPAQSIEDLGRVGDNNEAGIGSEGAFEFVSDWNDFGQPAQDVGESSEAAPIQVEQRDTVGSVEVRGSAEAAETNSDAAGAELSELGENVVGSVPGAEISQVANSDNRPLEPPVSPQAAAPEQFQSSADGSTPKAEIAPVGISNGGPAELPSQSQAGGAEHLKNNDQSVVEAALQPGVLHNAVAEKAGLPAGADMPGVPIPDAASLVSPLPTTSEAEAQAVAAENARRIQAAEAEAVRQAEAAKALQESAETKHSNFVESKNINDGRTEGDSIEMALNAGEPLEQNEPSVQSAEQRVPEETMSDENVKSDNELGGVQLDHVLQPEFKGSDNATRLTGLHHIEGSQDLEKGRVADLLSGPNKHGIYEAVVEAKNPSDGANYQKFSTMFPDHYTKDDVEACIKNAHKYGNVQEDGRVVGPSGRGFDIVIQGKTAFPMYSTRGNFE